MPAVKIPSWESAIIRYNIRHYGKFLFASPMVLTGNTGFNFSPGRDLSEAVFWNPAMLAERKQNGGVNLFTNFKNNVKFSGSYRVSDFVTIGIGMIYTKQDAFQEVTFGNQQNTVAVQHLQELKEYAVYLPAVFRLTRKGSAGITLKSTWQEFNQPFKLSITDNPPANTFTDFIVKKQVFDANVSFSYSILPSLKAGINIMNVAGSELHSSVFVNGSSFQPMVNLRSAGLGLCYRWKQFNFGTDALFTKDGLYDVSVGANYVPFNNALISAGFAFKQKAFSASFRWKQFRTSFVSDNDLMVNEKRPGKSKIQTLIRRQGLEPDFVDYIGTKYRKIS